MGFSLCSLPMPIRAIIRSTHTCHVAAMHMWLPCIVLSVIKSMAYDTYMTVL